MSASSPSGLAAVTDLSQSDKTPAGDTTHEKQEYIKGWRFYMICTAMSLGVFLINLEITIISTSLISISNDLHSFQRGSWIVNAYMVTFTGFIVVLAKLSDIFGRKLCVLLSLAAFTIFSGACGAAQTMDQLIVLRAIQGIGAAGANGVLRTMFFELVPPARYAAITGVITVIYALCYLVGPLLGGVISMNTTWRWVFLINVPSGAVVISVLTLVLPRRLTPRSSRPDSHLSATTSPSLRDQLRRIDYVGVLLLLAATVLLVTALEESNTQYSWRSALIICMLAVSGLAWIASILWSWWQASRPYRVIEPAFSWRLLTNRSCVGMLLVTTIAGAPLLTCAVSLPLRFQSVNGLSPLEAGIHLLPYSVMVPVGAAASSLLLGKTKVPPLLLMLFGSTIQVLGLSLLGWASPTVGLKPSFYGYQIIVGFGAGIVFTAVTIAVQFVIEARDRAVANGAIVQFRLIGGAIGLAATTAAFNNNIRSHLTGVLTPDELSSLLSSSDAIDKLSGAVAEEVRSILVAAYSLEFRISAGISVAQLIAIGLIWKKRYSILPR